MHTPSCRSCFTADEPCEVAAKGYACAPCQDNKHKCDYSREGRASAGAKIKRDTTPGTTKGKSSARSGIGLRKRTSSTAPDDEVKIIDGPGVPKPAQARKRPRLKIDLPKSDAIPDVKATLARGLAEVAAECAATSAKLAHLNTLVAKL